MFTIRPIPLIIHVLIHGVAGKVIDGMLVVRKIENVPVGPNNRPKLNVVISQCGQM